MGTLTIGTGRVWKIIVSRYKMATWQSFWIKKRLEKNLTKDLKKNHNFLKALFLGTGPHSRAYLASPKLLCYYVYVATITEWLIYEYTYTRQAQLVMTAVLYFLKHKYEKKNRLVNSILQVY